MTDAQPKQWLADFTVWSTLKLPADTPKLEFTHSGGDYVAHLENAPADAADFTLCLRVVMPAASLDDAHALARPHADSFLNLLSFITQTPFRIIKINRLMDWTPGVKDREMYVYYVRPADQIVGELAAPFIATAQTLEGSGVSEQAESAMRWFAAAVRAPIMSDQFRYFWFVIELVAAQAKLEKVTDICSHCKTVMHCPKCDGPSTHKPYPSQRIRQFMVAQGVPEWIVEGIEGCRHRLMHGATHNEIEEFCSGLKGEPNFQKVIDAVGEAAWRSIQTTFKLGDDVKELHLAKTESFVPLTMTMRAHMRVGYPGDPQSPSMDNLHIPNIEVSMIEMDENGKELKTKL
jgi:hypothetical protein